MKTEEKVVDLETAKKLRNAGYSAYSEHAWYFKPCDCDSGHWVLLDELNHTMLRMKLDENFKVKDLSDCLISAPDTSELIEAIDKLSNEMAIGYDSPGCFWHVTLGGNGASYHTQGIGRRFNGYDLEVDNLVSVLAYAWIHFTK